MFCYKCGSEINDNDNAKFCRHCGAEIRTISTEGSADFDSKTDHTENLSAEIKAKKKISKGLIFGIAGVAVCIIVLVLILGSIRPTNVSTETEEIVSSTETKESGKDEQFEVTQQTESTTKEDVDIKTIHMSPDNMRPTILETSDIKVHFNRFSYANGETVFEVNFIVENDTDEEISVLLTDVIVNGYDVSTSTGKTLVKPGHKANCDSSVWQESIDETGESEWDTIEGVIEVRKGYWDDILYSIPVVIDKACWEYEGEYSKNNPIDPVVSSDLTEIPEGATVISEENLYPKLVKEDDVTATVSDYSYANEKTVFEINFTMENNTDEDLEIFLTDVVVDGYDISTSTGITLVKAGHKAVCDSSVWLQDMEEVGINDWIVLKGTVKISEGYWDDPLYSIPVVIYRNAWKSAA